MSQSAAIKATTIPQTDYKYGDKVTVLIPHEAVISGYTYEYEGMRKGKVVKNAVNLVVSLGGQGIYTVHPDDVTKRGKK